jgi:lipoprotein-releasing system permease protein
VDGELVLRENGMMYAIIGRGVQYALSIGIEENIFPLQVFYIKNTKSSSLDPSQLYAQRALQPGGVFSIEKNIDENFIFVPLDFANDLLNYGKKRTSLEIQTKPGSSVNEVQHEIKKTLGDSFRVLTNEEQHQDIYRLMKIEKLFTFLALSMLIVVASINIFFSLMMLALDKKKDISILAALGAHESFIQKIFLNEGALIALLGAGIGLMLGGAICWLQDTFGLVGMGMENAIMSSYPVKMKFTDFLLTASVIISITALVSFYPAHKASQNTTPQHL